MFVCVLDCFETLLKKLGKNKPRSHNIFFCARPIAHFPRKDRLDPAYQRYLRCRVQLFAARTSRCNSFLDTRRATLAGEIARGGLQDTSRSDREQSARGTRGARFPNKRVSPSESESERCLKSNLRRQRETSGAACSKFSRSQMIRRIAPSGGARLNCLPGRERES